MIGTEILDALGAGQLATRLTDTERLLTVVSAPGCLHLEPLPIDSREDTR